MAINVLHVYKTAEPFTHGGIEHVLEQLSRSLATYDVKSTVLCLQRESKQIRYTQHQGVDIIGYPLDIEIASCGLSRKLWQDFKRISADFDLIHYQFPWPYADALACFRQAKTTPYVVSYQSDIVKQKQLLKLYTPLMKRFLKGAARIAGTSPQYISSSPVLGQYADQVDIIPNGIEDHELKDVDSAQLMQYEQQLGNQFFLFVGVFRYYKGLEYLLQAALKTGYKVVLAGDGPERENLKQYVQQNQLENVIFLGKVSEKQKFALLKLCYAFVLPSSQRSEAFGMVLLEAARFAKPLISTELQSGTSFINLNHQTGRVVPARDSDALANAMRQLHDNPAQAALMGEAARQRFLAHFTAQRQAKLYAQMYQKALNP